MKISLYHVTKDITTNATKEFTPRIPQSTGDGEDIIIPRVCLSDCIETCIQAAYGYVEPGDLIQVYSCVVSDDEKIISPEYLKENNFVPDALENREYWCLQKIQMTSKVYKVVKCDYKIDLAWTIITVKDILNVCNKLITDKELLHKMVPTDLSSEQTYIQVCDVLNKMGLNDKIDRLWEELADLPWAQVSRVMELKLVEATNDEINKYLQSPISNFSKSINK